MKAYCSEIPALICWLQLKEYENRSSALKLFSKIETEVFSFNDTPPPSKVQLIKVESVIVFKLIPEKLESSQELLDQS
jgi:hypothetical protein